MQREKGDVLITSQMKQGHADIDRPYRQGKLAYLNIRPESSNPYPDGPEKHEWDDGWCAAKELRPDIYLEYFAPAVKHSDEKLINKSSDAYRKGRLAHVMNIPRFKNPYSTDRQAAEWNAGYDDYNWTKSQWPVEEIITARGESIRRLTSSFFYTLTLSLIFFGVVMIKIGWENIGVSMLMLSPTFSLYPAVRFLFGGKGGFLPMAVAYILGKLIPHLISRAGEDSRKKRH